MSFSARLFARRGVAARLGVMSLVPAVVLGCASHRAPDAFSGPTTVSGQVYLSAGQSLPRDAELTVSLVDATISGSEQTVATKTEKASGLPPYAFTLDAGPDTLRQGRMYQVRAVLKAGQKTWSHNEAYPVLTGGAPDYVEIMVLPR